MSAYCVVPCTKCPRVWPDFDGGGVDMSRPSLGSFTVPLDAGRGPFYMRCSACDAAYVVRVRHPSVDEPFVAPSALNGYRKIGLAGGYEVEVQDLVGEKPEGHPWRG